MKRTILAALAVFVALMGFASGNTDYKVHEVSGNGFTMHTNNSSINITVDSVAGSQMAKATVVVNGDTAIIANIDKDDIVRGLNDTLYASSSYSYAYDEEGDDGNGFDADYRYMIQNDKREAVKVIVLTAIVFGAIFLTVMACLVIYYLNRRRRMKVIEKAIENNYQLPDSFYTGNSSTWRNSAKNATNAETQRQPAMTMAQQIFNYNNDRETRNGITLAIVGLGMILVFAFMGLEFLAALSVIPFLIGVSRSLPFFLAHRGGMPVPPPQPQQPTTTPPQQPNATTTVPPTFTHDDTAANRQEETK